jgi:hypothetical protein
MTFDGQGWDGFASYGPTGFVPLAAGVEDLRSTLLAGEWTSVVVYGAGITADKVTCTVIDSLFGPGQALRIAYTGGGDPFGVGAGGLSQTLDRSYGRLVVGFYFRAHLSSRQCIVFGDAGVDQMALTVEPSGQIAFRKGGGLGSSLGFDGGAVYGPIAAISDQSVAEGEVCCVVADLVFDAAAGKVKVWLNNNPTSLDLTGQDTQFTTNASVNQIRFCAAGGNTHIDVGHFNWRGYISGAATESAINVNQIVEEQFPTGDDSVDFAFGAAVLGPDYSATAATNAPGANQLALRQYVPEADGMLQSITIVPAVTSLTAKFKSAAFDDSGGAAHAVASDGVEHVGCTAHTELTLALATPVAVTMGTPVWVGVYGDTSIALNLTDASTPGYKVANAYGSGTPAIVPATTALQPAWVMFGEVTGLTADFFSVVNRNPVSGELSYMTSSSVGDQDLFTFPNLYSTPTTIFGVAVKAVVRRADAGFRQMDLRTKSAATTGSGSDTGLALAATKATIVSDFDVDPDTGAAWNASGLNLAKHGYKITG